MNLKNKIALNTIIGGIENKVGFVDFLGNRDELGSFFIATSKIQLAKTCRGIDITNSSLQTTYIHECVHAMLENIGYKELSSDETFVQGLTSQIAGWLNYSEFEDINIIKNNLNL